MKDWLARHRLEAALTLRMSAAGLIAFAIGHALGLAQVFWAVLTAVIVMQASVGGSLKAMFDRFVGTIVGAFWGAAVTLSLPHATVVQLGLALAAALVPLAAAAAMRPTLRVAPVTAAIVLLGQSALGGGIVMTALDRVFEIGLGSAVALAVALLISPTRAHEVLRVAGLYALSLMAEQLRALLGDLTVAPDAAAVLASHDRIRAAVERAAAAADEARHERRSHLTEAPDLDPLVRNLRRLGHDLILMSRALSAPLPEAVATRLARPAADSAAALSAALVGIGTAWTTGSRPPDPAGATQVLGGFAAEIAALRRDGVIRALPEEAVEQVFGLAFALDQIGRHLEELTARVTEIAAAR